MSKTVYLLCILISLFAGKVLAQSATLKGRAPEYAGMELPVFRYVDFISEEKAELGRIRFQQNGSFSAVIKLPSTMVCFAEFDVYQASLYMEAGKTYELQFPPRQQKSEAQKRNPFFNPMPVWFLIVNQQPDDLNLLIKNFETEFRRLEDKYFYDIYEKRLKSSLQLVQNELLQKFPKTENRYFEEYKKYRLANLEFALHQGRSAEYVSKYFGNVKPMMELPAYTNLFNQIFTNYFSFLGNSLHDQKITTLVNSGDVNTLENYLAEKNGWTPEACRVIILRSLKDAYYSGQFSKQAIIGSLKQACEGNWPDMYKQIARNILQKISYLIPGSELPRVSFVRADGQSFSLEQFKGKFVYLHFTDLQNPVCRQHLEALNPIAEQLKNNLVVVLVNEGKVAATEATKYNGTFVTTDEKGKAAWKVKTFPTSYLIGRDGKILQSPALNPMNGIDSQLRSLLEKERIEKLRSGK